MKRLSRSTAWRVLAVLGAVFAFVLGGSSAATATPRLDVARVVSQFVAEESDSPDDGSEDSDDSESNSDDSEDSDDEDSEDENSDEESDEPTDEPTEAPTTGYNDPSSDGSVEMPTSGADDTAAAEEAAANRPLGFALVGGGLLAAIAAFVVFRRMG